MIETEHDPRLHGDAVLVKTPDDFAIFGGAIVAFVGNVEAGSRVGLEAEEERFASAPSSERHKFVVERDVSSALAGPPTFQRCDRREEFFCPGTVRADVIIPENQ